MTNLKELLKNDLTEKELEIAPSSFEVIGSKEKSVAIVEIPDALEAKKKIIAQKIMQISKSVKTVLKKVSERKGEFRTREFEIIAGDEDTEVLHKEYGYVLKVDPQLVYFSPRESTERQRIAKQVKENENILVMFSGIAPFPIAIAKMQPNVKKIYAIESNQIANSYAEENVRINRIADKIILLNENVTKILPTLNEKFDRIVMPLPEEGYKFLDLAIGTLKDDGIVHFYFISKEPDLFSEAKKLIEECAERLKRKIEIILERKVLPYAPRKWKIVIDTKIFKSSQT